MAEPTLTKDEWAKVETALSGLIGHVKLKVDGRIITLDRTFIKKNRLGIIVYVDGTLNLKWCFPAAGESFAETRYYRPVSRWYWTPASRARLKKKSKRFLKEMGYDPDRKLLHYSYYWTDPAAIRRHYQKIFTSIELIVGDEC